MQVWIAADIEAQKIEAAMVTQIHTYPRMKVCSVEYVRGTNMKNWAKSFAEVSEAFARSQGCKRMCGGHRRGWVKIAGYTEVGPMLFKNLYAERAQ